MGKFLFYIFTGVAALAFPPLALLMLFIGEALFKK